MILPQETNPIQQLENTAMAVVENVCAIGARPVELIIRPWHGTRYFQVPVIFFSTLLMILLPLFSTLATGALRMIPLLNIPAPIGVFSIGSLAKLYFILSALHGGRLWRRILYPDLEQLSTYEGPPLPILQLFPKYLNHFFTRIITEPVLVFVIATVLGRLFIFQSSLTTYLQIAAMMLAVKEYIAFYRSWEYLRDLRDAKFIGPIISSIVNNEEGAEDMAAMHFATLPRNLSPDLRHAAMANIARVFSHETKESSEQTSER
jgi:hypothetical protein